MNMKWDVTYVDWNNGAVRRETFDAPDLNALQRIMNERTNINITGVLKIERAVEYIGALAQR